MVKCSRCESAAVTGKYTATSNMALKNDKNKDWVVRGTTIQTCNECTSPKSRKNFETMPVFTRFEPKILNDLLGLYVDNPKKYNVMLNNVNHSDKKRYDVLIELKKPDDGGKRSIVVEIDEKQHYDTPKQFEADRLKEANYFIQKERYNKASHLRVRVSEDSKDACIEKNKRKCVLKDEKKYFSNLEKTKNYIKSALGEKPANITKAYIDYSKNESIKPYEYKTFSDVKEAKKVTKSVNNITKTMKNVKIEEVKAPKVQRNAATKPKVDKSLCKVCGRPATFAPGKCGYHKN